MADITKTAALCREIEVIENRHLALVTDEDIAAGDVIYVKSNGRAAKARANAVGTAKIVGIATRAAAAGTPVTALYHGRYAGWYLSGVDSNKTVYLSTATAGAIADAAATGTGNVVAAVGRVFAYTNPTAQRYVFVDISLNASDPVALS
ncbi:MAG TPA: hypothetical protein VFQ54_07845 [Thermomicrobiales bacterium]|nr:hypothetical protein [Thermomicrobiales bacterium]